jgi:hypothetical protein
MQDPSYPRPGCACVSVIRFPEDCLEQLQKHHFKIGELVMHAVRYDGKKSEPGPGGVEITIAPPALEHRLPVKAIRGDTLLVDLRHVDPRILPPQIRDVVPDDRMHSRD